jgi:predicted permease
MFTTFGALAPIFVVIGLGALLRMRGFDPPGFWTGAEAVVYRLLFPPLLFLTTARAELEGFVVVPLAATLIGAIALTGGAAFVLRRTLGVDPAAFTSVFQGAIRCNTYVAIAAASALWGEAGLTVMGIVAFVAVSTVNVASIVVLVASQGGPVRLQQLAWPVVGNPLIQGCVLGFAWNALGLPLPGVVEATLEVLARGSLPLALLSVGAGLDLGALRHQPRALIATSALKLVALPVMTVLLGRLFGVEGLTLAGAVLFMSAPIAASAYVLARQLGGDAQLLASLITITTIGAALTMPLALAAFT